jgi:signal transduction histidine kinase
MPASLVRLRLPTWLRPPRRTARLRLTTLYSGLFLLSGASLVAVTYALFRRATALAMPQLPQIPNTPSVQNLQDLPVGQAFLQLSQDQKQLAQVSTQLGQAVLPGKPSGFTGPLVNSVSQLTQDQHQLAQATNHLAQAVHQLARAGTVQAAQRAADSHQLLVNSGIALAIVAVLALLAGWIVAGRMLRPIRTITRTARRISSTSLHERLALDGPDDELKDLGDTLNGLFARLESAFDAQRHFVANASHELRTPLTAERTLLQVALDDPNTTIAEWQSTAKEVLASSDEQERLIEALLALASSESGLNGREPVDLATTVTASLVELQPEIDQPHIHVDESTSPATVDGDPLLVERLVGNLLANAVRHNGGEGRVEVTTEVKEGKAVLSVTNSGPLIAPADVDRLFQPFERLGPRRANYKDGHGLGLSIVRAIANAHGAAITAEPMPNGGLSVRVVFPPPKNANGTPGKLSERNGHSFETEMAAL